MYRIRTFNKISPVGLNRLDPALYAVSDSETDEDAILVRSAKLLDYDFPKNLLAISRAGAGVNNIPLDRCSEAGIVVFNTPGANANAVKELVLCAMLMGSRDVDGGIQWVRQQVASGVDVTTVVEKGKAAFIGPELYKKTLGVIGLGAIGVIGGQHRIVPGHGCVRLRPLPVCGRRPAAGPPHPCGEGHQRALQAGGLYHHPHPLHHRTRSA